MNLLIITQKVDKNDENLGAFYYWFEEFAKKFDRVDIVAGSVGESSPPPNVFIHSLGKDRGLSKVKRVWNFLKFFSRYFPKSDIVFFHMIPEYVLAASPFLIFKFLNRRLKSALWYAHKSVTWKLKLAERLVDCVFSSSEAGFRIPSKKVFFVGQAIATDFFKPKENGFRAPRGGIVRMVTIGRISPVKNYEIIINACAALKNIFSRPWLLSIVGGPLMPQDRDYLESLKKMVVAKELQKFVNFQGPRPFSEMPEILREHDLFLNLSSTGSLDKAVLEAMSCGLSVLTSNEAYRSILPLAYFLEHLSPEFIAERVKKLADEERPNMALRNIVIENHGLQKTVGKIISVLMQ